MLPFRSEFPAVGRAGRRPRAALLALLLLGLGTASFAAAGKTAAADLGARLQEHFRVTIEDGSIDLRPLEKDSAIRSITLDDSENEAEVNGKAFSSEELRAFLGEPGAAIAELAALDADGRRAALGAVTAAPDTGVEAGRGAVAPVPPMPPMPPIPGRHHFKIESDGDDRVSFGRSIEVKAGETTGDVVCIGCSITIAGQAEGDAVAVGGSVHVESGGSVQGDAVGVGGKVEVESGATIEGDAVAVGGSVQVADGATVEGQRSTVGWGQGLGGHGKKDWTLGRRSWSGSDFGDFFWSVVRALVLMLLCCVAVLLARSSVERTSRRLTDEPWKAIFAGLLTQLLFLPVLIFVIVILAVSIIGIPLLVLVPVALVALLVATVLGFTAVAQSIGRWAAGRFGWNLTEPFLPVVVGIAMIQGLTIVARLIGLAGGALGLFAFGLVALGFFIKYAAWTMGLGAMTLSLLARDWRRRDAAFAAAAPAALAPASDRAPGLTAPEPPSPPMPPPPAAPPVAPSASSAHGEPEVETEAGTRTTTDALRDETAGD